MTHEDYINQLRVKQVEIACGMLDGEVGIIEGVRQLVAIQNQFATSDDDDSLLLRGIESESDNFPLDDSRKYWNDAALKVEDTKIREFESSFRDQVLDICRRINADLRTSADLSNP